MSRLRLSAILLVLVLGIPVVTLGPLPQAPIQAAPAPTPLPSAPTSLVTYDFGADISPSTRAAVQDTVASALRFFAGTFQYGLSVPFTVHLYSRRDELLELAARDLQMTREEAARRYSTDLGFATEKPRAIWTSLTGTCLTTSRDNLACDIKHVIYHEMFHLWQHELGVRTWYTQQSLRGAYIESWWVYEGTADFAAYLGIQRLGFVSAQDTLIYLKQVVRRHGAVNSLSDLAPVQGRAIGSRYPIAALAFFRLAGDEPARITAFFRHNTFPQDWRRAFELTFGRSVQAFEQEFKTELEAIVAGAAPSPSPPPPPPSPPPPPEVAKPPVPNDRVVIPGERVGAARVGDSLDEAIRIIGEVPAVASSQRPGQTTGWINYQWKNRHYVMIDRQTRIILQAGVWAPNPQEIAQPPFRVRDVGLGSELSDLTRVFGQPDSTRQRDTYVLYVYNRLGIGFAIGTSPQRWFNGQVYEIFVFKPGTFE